MLFGQGISSFGDSISNTAMPILVLALTGSGFAMGIVGVLSTLPDLLVGLPAGAYADRWDRRKMMLGADLGRAVLTALVPISVWLGGPTLAVIIVVAFPINVLRVLWLAAYTAAVPGLVGRGQVPARTPSSRPCSTSAGSSGRRWRGCSPVRSDPGRRSPSMPSRSSCRRVSLLFVRRPLRPERRAEQTHILADIREGVAFVARQPTLRAVIALWTAIQVISAGLTTALIFYVTQDRGLGTAVVGIVLSAFALGALGGSLLAARMAPRAVGPVMLGGAVGFGLTLVISVGAPVPLMVVDGAARGHPQRQRARRLHLAADHALARCPAGARGRDGAHALGRA